MNKCRDWTERLNENPDENPVICRICKTDENIIDYDDICRDCEELS